MGKFFNGGSGRLRCSRWIDLRGGFHQPDKDPLSSHAAKPCIRSASPVGRGLDRLFTFARPRQSSPLVGIEVLMLGLIIWTTISLFDINIWRKTESKYRRRYARLIVINQITVLPYIVSGALILSSGFGGLYWMSGAVICSFIMATLNAWVLFVEINR
jgi:hypothetical protein